MGVTKYWQPQNIGGDNIHMSTKLLASTKYWHQQNVGADKILASTKYGRQQTPGIAKILVSTKSWGQQKDVTDSKESSYCLAIRVHNC